MDPTLIQWIVGQGGTAGLAALALYMLKHAYDERLRERDERIRQGDEYNRRLEQLYKETRDALNSNTEVLTEALLEIRNLAGRDGRR
jgi:hypothetical protein